MKATSKILIVDDDPRIVKMTRTILENRNFEVVEAHNGLDAIEVFKKTSPDLILMDVMMPVLDGIRSCLRLREITSIPILMLTAKGEDDDQVLGLDCGADDYIIKPYTPMVLVARIEAFLRRSQGQSEDTLVKYLRFDDLKINLESRSVEVRGHSITLNKKEFDLLVYLAENANISMSRSQILEHVWGFDYLGTENTVDTHVNRLRNKLGDVNHLIKTERGYGYKFGG